jgi:hypothetical protein
MLIEMLCYIAIVIIIFGLLTQSTTLMARSLSQSAKDEARLQQWTQLAQAIRDDLRQATSIAWQKSVLALSRADGAMVEYAPGENDLERRVMRGGVAMETKTYHNYRLAAVRYSAEGYQNAWDLKELAADEALRASATPRFVLLTIEDGGVAPASKGVRSDFPKQLVGAAMRLEVSEGGAAKL